MGPVSVLMGFSPCMQASVGAELRVTRAVVLRGELGAHGGERVVKG